MSECEFCHIKLERRPYVSCENLKHWTNYANALEDKLELRDEDRDKFDVAEWLENYEKVKSYNCHSCNRHYQLPTHLTVFTCICGHRCRLRHCGGTDPDAAIIDAVVEYFGLERTAQLAWIAEVVGGEHCLNYSADEIRKMIKQEIDRWTLTDNQWRKKK